MQLLYFLYFAFAPFLAFSLTISEIQGTTWISPVKSQSVVALRGIVTALDSGGFWVTSLPGQPQASIYVDCSKLDGTYRPRARYEVLIDGNLDTGFTPPGNSLSIPMLRLYATSFRTTSPKLHTIRPLVLNSRFSPPTQRYTRLDNTECSILECTQGFSSISESREQLNIRDEGLDFWRSIEGTLVTVVSPIAAAVWSATRAGFWGYGSTWPVTGKNGRGGLCINRDSDGFIDMNPEAIFIGEPLDGTGLPAAAMGTELLDITGIIAYQDGIFRLLPLTRPIIISNQPTTPVSAQLKGSPYDPRAGCERISILSYNVKGLGWNRRKTIQLASEIEEKFHLPHIILLQEVEVQDPQKEVAPTMNELVNLIGADYRWLSISVPEHEVQRRNLLRNVLLYRESILNLVPEKPDSPVPDAHVIKQGDALSLNFNPGLVTPWSDAFRFMRRPIAALFKSIATGRLIFIVNVHLAPRSATFTHANERPPNDQKLLRRRYQSRVTAEFVKEILQADPQALVIVGGDFNDSHLTESVFKPFTDLGMQHAAALAGFKDTERYTLVHNMNSAQTDHFLVSPAVAKAGISFEFIHLNTWSKSYVGATSDHDPIQMVTTVCKL